jgi:hypothetical protein
MANMGAKPNVGFLTAARGADRPADASGSMKGTGS